MKELTQLIVFLLGLFGSIFLAIVALDKHQCTAYEKATGRPTKYVGFACFVEYKGSWYDGKEFNNILRAEGASK